jgi:hypothetical protein
MSSPHTRTRYSRASQSPKQDGSTLPVDDWPDGSKRKISQYLCGLGRVVRLNHPPPAPPGPFLLLILLMLLLCVCLPSTPAFLEKQIMSKSNEQE